LFILISCLVFGVIIGNAGAEVLPLSPVSNEQTTGNILLALTLMGQIILFQLLDVSQI